MNPSLHQSVGNDAVEVDSLALEGSLERLGQLNSRHGRIAELRVFGGLEILEIARKRSIGLVATM